MEATNAKRFRSRRSPRSRFLRFIAKVRARRSVVWFLPARVVGSDKVLLHIELKDLGIVCSYQALLRPEEALDLARHLQTVAEMQIEIRDGTPKLPVVDEKQEIQ